MAMNDTVQRLPGRTADQAPLPIPDLAVLELPPAERDGKRLDAVAAALGGGTVLELPFLRSLDAEELLHACRTQLRIERLAPGEAICLQGEEADSAYVVLSGTVSCHIRKDLQQMDTGTAYAALLKEFIDDIALKKAALEKKSLAADSACTDDAEDSVSMPAGGAVAPAGGAASARPTSPVLQRVSGGGYVSGGSEPRYLMVPNAEAAVAADAGAGGAWRRAAAAVATSSAAAASVRHKASAVVGVSVAVLGVGDSFGESSLLNSATVPRRAATAVCNTHTALLICPRGALASSAGADREQKMLEWMKMTPALSGCSNAALLQLLRNSKRRIYAMGDLLHGSGSSGTSLNLLYSGEVTLFASPATADPHGPTPVLASPRDLHDKRTPRELPLRKLGPGQVITCTPTGAGLQDGCTFATSSRVSSAHAQVLLLECRFIWMVLSKQDAGRGLAELVGHLNDDAARSVKQRTVQRERWRDGELSTKVRKPLSASTELTAGVNQDARGQPATPRSPRMVEMARPAQGHAPSRRYHFDALRKAPTTSDPLVNATSRFTDPANPTGMVSTMRPTLTPRASADGDYAYAVLAHHPPSASARRQTRPPSAARTVRPASARRANEPSTRIASGLSVRAAVPLPSKEGTSGSSFGAASLAGLELAITPRQLRLRPQSASASATAHQYRQQEWLAKTKTLQRLQRSETPRNSVTDGEGDAERSQPPREPRKTTTSSISVHISGDSSEGVGVSKRQQPRPTSARRSGTRHAAPAGSAASAGSWQPSQVEWRHVARLSAARGERPPAVTGSPEAVLTPGRGQTQEDNFSQQRLQALMAQRAPLAISTLDPSILYRANAPLAPESQSIGGDAPPIMPLFTRVKRPPKASAQVMASFYEEAVAAGLIVGRTKNGSRNVSSRTQGRHSHEEGAENVGTESSPRSPSMKAARRSGSSTRPPLLWTRPVSVDGPQLALALALAPPLA